ncbi:MAG: hypothetical protein D6826_05140 [Alphaproteobacteria bacterium]|nr:MAG: hypothetical protein D6826_05140 [Alphaproteobacteria bacterium]
MLVGPFVGLCTVLGIATVSATVVRAAPIVYDFRTPAAAAALDGTMHGTLTVDGRPLDVRAGRTTAAGLFTFGSDTLSIDASEGLGVNDTQIRDVIGMSDLFTAVRFAPDPQVVVRGITVRRFFDSEDLRVFVDGALLGDCILGVVCDFATTIVDAATGEVEIGFGALAGISNLMVTTVTALSDDSDYFVAALRAHAIPEPSGLALALAGLIAMAATGAVTRLRVR